jgi:hypothetical protein
MSKITLNASYYQQFDADERLDVPAEGYAGWQCGEVALDMQHTAVVVMHAWSTGTRAQYPGWYRAVEYIPRAQHILNTVFPQLLGEVRACGVQLFHVVGGGDYYRAWPGYQRAVQLCGPATPPEQITSDPAYQQLQAFRAQHVFVGSQNEADVARGFEQLNFPPQARPQGDEGIAENADQLFALCKAAGVNHLIYAGFAINWCLLMSPGGMVDMSRHGMLCSAFRQAVTAVENKASARTEGHKEEALWRVALAFGFVFDVDDFVQALRQMRSRV